MVLKESNSSLRTLARRWRTSARNIKKSKPDSSQLCPAGTQQTTSKNENKRGSDWIRNTSTKRIVKSTKDYQRGYTDSTL